MPERGFWGRNRHCQISSRGLNWVVTSCSVVIEYQRFRGTCCLVFPHKEVQRFKQTQVEILWVVTPCGVVVGYQRYRGPRCICVRGESLKTRTIKLHDPRRPKACDADSNCFHCMPTEVSMILYGCSQNQRENFVYPFLLGYLHSGFETLRTHTNAKPISCLVLFKLIVKQVVFIKMSSYLITQINNGCQMTSILCVRLNSLRKNNCYFLCALSTKYMSLKSKAINFLRKGTLYKEYTAYLIKIYDISFEIFIMHFSVDFCHKISACDGYNKQRILFVTAISIHEESKEMKLNKQKIHIQYTLH
jgi:hypothetical protein